MAIECMQMRGRVRLLAAELVESGALTLRVAAPYPPERASEEATIRLPSARPL
ncbi:MAG TPA: hypothetical protein VIG57_18460 [Candidatus Entotheonella sp.]|jgi:hypothetical protein